MSTESTGSIPRWRSLTPINLFAGGPWEILLPALGAGALVAIAWLVSPRVRIAAVTDWRIAAVAGAALASMISVRSFARIWSDARGAWPFVFASTVAGGVVFAAASQSVFAPALTRASDCAPFVAIGESVAGRIVSYVLPAAMWIAWSFYLLTRFPHIENVSQLMHGRESRYQPYKRALHLFLPWRLIISAIVVAAVVAATFLFEPRRDDPSRPELMIAMLARADVALIDHARGGIIANRLRALREREQQKALTHLAALELDKARVAVRRCACDWVLPGDSIDPRIAAAEPAFQVIDREIDDWAFAWKPSAATAAVVIRLLPLGSGYDAKPPLYPLLWHESSPTPIAGARATPAELERVTYRNESIVLVRRSTIATESGSVLAEVAMKILGRSARDQALPDAVSERVQSPPSEGPCPLEGGSYCAMWSLGRLKLRLAPDENEPITPDTPLWLTLFDPAYVAPSKSMCCVTDSSAASR